MNSHPTERDAAIMRAYPDLFGPPPWTADQTCMAWGFAIGEGWRPILLDLLEELRHIVAANGLEGFRIIQVKEKFGGLRVYARPLPLPVRSAVERAEERAAMTCEVCGRPGELRMGGTIQTLCDTCHARRPTGRRE